MITLVLQREIYDHRRMEVVEMTLLRQWQSQIYLTCKLLPYIGVFVIGIFDSIAVLLCCMVLGSEAEPCYRGHPLPRHKSAIFAPLQGSTNGLAKSMRVRRLVTFVAGF
jgi:hypothetical protein